MGIENKSFETGADLLAYCAERSQPGEHFEEKEADRLFRIVDSFVMANELDVVNALQNKIFLEQVPQLVELNLYMINAPKIAFCASDLLQTSRSREGLILDLGRNRIDDAGAKALAAALESGKCRSGLTLDLTGNLIRLAGIRALCNALKSGKCPPGLTLVLRDLPDFGLSVTQAFVEAFESGLCPENLTLDLQDNLISNKCCSVLTQVLGSGKCPRGLTLNLSKNSIRLEDFFALIDVLGSGECPTGLTLVLGHNDSLRDAVAKAFAQLIASGRCPQGLTLELSENHFKDEGFFALVEALGSEACPCGLTLVLKRKEGMGDAVLQAFAKLIAGGGLKEGVHVDLGVPIDTIEISVADSNEFEPGFTPEPEKPVKQGPKDTRPLTFYQKLFGKKPAEVEQKPCHARAGEHP